MLECRPARACCWVRARHTGQFELLGALVGGLAFCNQHTLTMRVAKAQDCLDALADLPCPQTAFLLLRSCASFACGLRARGRLVRVRQPRAHLLGASGLTAHGRRQCWAFPLAGWACAVLPGMLRLHTWPLWHPPLRPALSSTGSTRLTWPSPLLSLTGPCLPPTLCPPLLGRSSSRTCLLRLMLRPPSHFFKAAATSPCALTCSLSDNWCGRLAVPRFFRTLLRLRLRLPVADSEGFCPVCDAVADRFGDHARACACGGDRTKRGITAPGLSLRPEQQLLACHLRPANAAL